MLLVAVMQIPEKATAAIKDDHTARNIYVITYVSTVM
jgi:hypothetical protein